MYLDKTNQTLQIQEYESINRINTDDYRIIVIDEIRSMFISVMRSVGRNFTCDLQQTARSFKG